jgi:hypothetical protein
MPLRSRPGAPVALDSGGGVIGIRPHVPAPQSAMLACWDRCCGVSVALSACDGRASAAIKWGAALRLSGNCRLETLAPERRKTARGTTNRTREWGGCCWAGVFAFPLVKLPFDGAEPARRTLTHARCLGCNLAALDPDGGASDSDSRPPACGSKEVHQHRLSQIDRS